MKNAVMFYVILMYILLVFTRSYLRSSWIRIRTGSRFQIRWILLDPGLVHPYCLWFLSVSYRV